MSDTGKNKKERLGQLNLLNELFVTDDDEKLMNFTRFTRNEFSDLPNKVQVKITNKYANYRKVISPGTSLALTLCLATRNRMTTLHYEFRVGTCAV